MSRATDGFGQHPTKLWGIVPPGVVPDSVSWVRLKSRMERALSSKCVVVGFCESGSLAKYAPLLLPESDPRLRKLLDTDQRK